MVVGMFTVQEYITIIILFQAKLLVTQLVNTYLLRLSSIHNVPYSGSNPYLIVDPLPHSYTLYHIQLVRASVDIASINDPV